MQTNLSFIKKHFNPVQPGLINTQESVAYQEMMPHPALQNYIYCYWELKTNQSLDEFFAYRVVADGCMDILWELNAPQQNFIIGFSSEHTIFPLENTFHYFGIRFLPTALPLLFNLDASELTNKFEALEAVVPNISQQLALLSEGVFSAVEIKTRLDQFFLGILRSIDNQPDTRICKALHLILQSKGGITIEQELDAGVSPRQLRRLFKFYIGDTPKVFSRVVRFQNILKAKPSRESLRKNKLFYDLGYYDQAHFIKEFKYMYGISPSKALL